MIFVFVEVPKSETSPIIGANMYRTATAGATKIRNLKSRTVWWLQWTRHIGECQLASVLAQSSVHSYLDRTLADHDLGFGILVL